MPVSYWVKRNKFTALLKQVFTCNEAVVEWGSKQVFSYWKSQHGKQQKEWSTSAECERWEGGEESAEVIKMYEGDGVMSLEHVEDKEVKDEWRW